PLTSIIIPHQPRPTLFPYTPLFRSCAFVQVVAASTVVVGHDMRPSSPGMAAAFAAGAAEAGADVVMIGLASTDQLYFASGHLGQDRKSTRLNSSHVKISYAVFCLKK